MAVVLDCDPGHDDAVAIWLAARNLDLRAVTTTHGNQRLDLTTTNALKVLEVAGVDLPVHVGADRPLLGGPTAHAAAVHGETGLDGPELPEPSRSPSDEPAVDAILRLSREAAPLSLCAVGPLTNVASAMLADRSLASRLESVTLMGGGVAYGNVTPTAEFNIWADPDAAAVVFSSGARIRMTPLDLTHQVPVTRERIERARSLGTPVADTAAALFTFYLGRIEAMAGRNIAAMHDPCAVAWLIDDTLIEHRPMSVAVETAGRLTRGMTVCDRRPYEGIEPTAEVGFGIDTDRFWELVFDALGG